MNIKPEETEIKGSWVVSDGGEIVADDNCRRIHSLTTTALTKISTDDSGWEALYQDPEDGRYWELTYLENAYHGGGPPSLRNVTEELVKTKYKTNMARTTQNEKI